MKLNALGSHTRQKYHSRVLSIGLRTELSAKEEHKRLTVLYSPKWVEAIQTSARQTSKLFLKHIRTNLITPYKLRNAYIRTRFFMFSLKNSTLPSKFNNLFPINSQIHNYNTRNVHSFRLPPCRTNSRHLSIYFQGPKFYNSLNSTITGPSSSTSFKRKLKEFLLSTY